MTIGQRIRQNRTDKGFTTQKAFANACNITPALMCKYENDRCKLTLENAVAIAKQLEVSIEYLLNGTIVDDVEIRDIHGNQFSSFKDTVIRWITGK